MSETIRRNLRYVREILRLHWKFFFLILFPLVIAIPIFLEDTKARRCLFVIVVMIAFWIFKILPVGVTSAIPFVLFPFFGISTPNEVAATYFVRHTFALLGAMVICTAIEESNLSERIALKILHVSKCSPRKVHVILCVVSAVMSVLYDNVSTAILMCPVAKSVLEHLEDLSVLRIFKQDFDAEVTTKGLVEDDGEGENEDEKRWTKKEVRLRRGDIEGKVPTKITTCFYLGIAFATLIGGICFSNSSLSQKTLNDVLKKRFPKYPGINFMEWLVIVTPIGAVLLIVMILWLQFLYLGLFRPNSKDATAVVFGHLRLTSLKLDVKEEMRRLGRLKFNEWMVSFIFILNFLLLFSKDPGFIKGWDQYREFEHIDVGTVTVFSMFLLFCIPKSLTSRGEDGSIAKSLITWEVVEEKVPWNMLILIGSSYAINLGFVTSGLYRETVNYLEYTLKGSTEYIMMILSCLWATLLTQLVMNTFASNTLLPLFADLAKRMKIHPHFLTIPSCICASFAFLFECSTPSNAIVVNTCNLPAIEMFKAGTFMLAFSMIFVMLVYPEVCDLFYDYHVLPIWA